MKEQKKNKVPLISAIVGGVVVVAVAIVAIILLNSGDVLKGTWGGTTNDGMEVTWKFDGSGGLKFTSIVLTDEPGTYRIEDGKVEIEMEAWSEPKMYEFEIDGNTLTLDATDIWSPDYELTKK